MVFFFLSFLCVAFVLSAVVMARRTGHQSQGMVSLAHIPAIKHSIATNDAVWIVHVE